VAAIANPLRATGTLRLILRLISDDDVELVGDRYLAEEMIRYAEVFPSDTAATLLEALASKMRIVKVEDRYIKICRGYMGTSDPSDIYHAAACLQSGLVMISDDGHFNRIRDEGIISVWGTQQAIKRLLGI
jgi:predicted nucleic acid-binding protein